jgi:hypothetical protein
MANVNHNTLTDPYLHEPVPLQPLPMAQVQGHGQLKKPLLEKL